MVSKICPQQQLNELERCYNCAVECEEEGFADI